MDNRRPEQTNRPDEPDETPPSVVVTVAITVTRTGGIAGIRRTWRAVPARADAPHWIALVDGCPWDDADPSRAIVPRGADRYLWHVDARLGDDEREAALPDPEVQGPWRELIDAVRSVSGRTAATS